MTLSWCVVHDSGWQDDGCFAAEVAEHGDLNDCRRVEMELHPAGTRVVSAEVLREIVGDLNQLENGPGPIRAADITALRRVFAFVRDALAQPKEGTQ